MNPFNTKPNIPLAKRSRRELTLGEMVALANETGTGAFSQEEIAAANRRHDQKYGWSIQWAGIYTNMGRHPESVVGPLDWTPVRHRPL